ncbi:MAG: hypothetical protein NTX53_19445, partial [candidate division WOR-3 bacterium]|nr:hypothetical protein [candidate division WOR-3 bacterium]
NIYGGVAVSGDYAYVADRYKGIRVIDISDPAATREVARCDTIGGTTKVIVHGQYAYTGNEAGGINVVDVSDPTNPRAVGATGVDLPVDRLALSGSMLCVSGQMDVPIVDVSEPVLPSQVGLYQDPILPSSIALQGSFLYVADASSRGGLRIADITEPAAPRELSVLAVPGRAYDVAVRESYVYIACGDSGLTVIDVADPAAPYEVGILRSLGHAYSIAVSGPYAYVAIYPGGLRIVDISDPANPREVGYHTRPGTAGNLAVQGSRVFTVDRGTNLNILENVLYGVKEAAPADTPHVGLRLGQNPVRGGSIDVRLWFDKPSDAGLDLYDVSGRLVRAFPAIRAASGYHDLHLPVGSLPPGAYVLRMTSPASTECVKVVLSDCAK